MRGRISALKVEARQNAAMDAKDGADYDQALAKYLRAFEPRLKKYRARLAKAQKNAPKDQPVAARSKRRGSFKKAASKPATPKEAQEAGDLLGALSAL